ncbi:MAG: phosphatase PAP2 family protein [Patescibacteria group bacterium]
MSDFNTKLFFKINNLVGKNRYFDAFSKAGAEWVIVTMIGWYVAADFLYNLPSKRLTFWPIAFLGLAWSIGWLINLFIGMLVREPRPHVIYPQAKLLFQPLMSWKSFPSDHTMSAFLIFFMALIFHLPGAWALLVMALWVAWGRIYAGVHYPFDIVGGFGVALFMSAVSYYILLAIF